ncbi:hypothetical protein CCAX7_21140 [Capsulimonas corticalis]|uniref:Uncharacterized protein n=1 Tax=Capsulimonas corticalis TaxID=2219043 RepID=A0A402D1U8_9BACT|nr:hypothetical protein CCAX7_21140 [Capsulimonas corticalis]
MRSRPDRSGLSQGRSSEGKPVTGWRVLLSDVASSEEAQALFLLYNHPGRGNHLLMYRWGQGTVVFPLPWDVRSICTHGDQLIACGDWSVFVFRMPRWELGAPLETLFS